MFPSLILSGVLVLYFIYRYVTKNNTYWKDRNVPYVEPVLFYGSVKDEIRGKKGWTNFSTECYKKFKNYGFGGAYLLTAPVLYICDLKLVEKILIEDFQFFQDRWVLDDSMSSSLTFGRGEYWRNTRSRLAPAFGKVRGMFQQMFTAADRTLRKIDDQIEKKYQTEIETLATAFSTEVIASCMLGVDMSDSYESIQLRKSLEQMNITTKNHSYFLILGMLKPKLLNLFKVNRAFKNAAETVSKLIENIIIFRLKNKTNRRNDILQVMLDVQDKAETDSREMSGTITNSNTISPNLQRISFTNSDIGQLIYNFFYSGIKPTAVTITFALFEIAKHSDVQRNIIKDIESSIAKYGGWNSEAIENMSYLDQVIQETLRLYSFTNSLMRILNKAYTLPGTNVTLPEGMHVFVPIDAIHKDPDFYPDPTEFKPERFYGHNYKATSTFLPFGQGPRICVAIRLAVTMVKLCLARILAQYKVNTSSKMQLPLEMSRFEFYPRVEGGMWLQFEKR